MRAPPILTLFTKDHCTLCDVVRAVIAHSTRPAKLVTVDITAPGREKWFERYKYDIPVVHLNGRFLAKHRLPPAVLDAALQRIEQTGTFDAPTTGDPNPHIDAGPTPLE